MRLVVALGLSLSFCAATLPQAAAAPGELIEKFGLGQFIGLPAQIGRQVFHQQGPAQALLHLLHMAHHQRQRGVIEAQGQQIGAVHHGRLP